MRVKKKLEFRQGQRSRCPINLTLEAIGDSWSLLIVRDLMFRGAKTYKELLDGGEGIATNILANRLARLQACGILRSERDPIDARRLKYYLTEKGIGLAPLLIEMILWGSGHGETDAPAELLDAIRSDREGFLERLYAGWRAADSRRKTRADRSRSGK
jgi:DNA-binding HxlR family transcriptional regulator